MANVLKCLTNVLWTLVNHSKIQNQADPQVFHDKHHSVVIIFTTDLTDWTELCPVCEQNKNRKNPLVRMEGVALAAILPLWSYKSELLTPKPKAYHHLPSEGHHPRQGDKQK